MRGEKIAVLTAGTVRNPYSDEDRETWDEGVAEREVVTIAPLEPRPSDEPVQDARNAIVSGWTLYLPAGDPITEANRVRVRGEVYPVQGVPADWGRGIIVQAFRTVG